jgi:hypothetical protein
VFLIVLATSLTLGGVALVVSVVSLIWVQMLNYGRSAPEARTVRRLISKLFQRRCWSLVGWNS